MLYKKKKEERIYKKSVARVAGIKKRNVFKDLAHFISATHYFDNL